MSASTSCATTVWSWGSIRPSVGFCVGMRSTPPLPVPLIEARVIELVVYRSGSIRGGLLHQRPWLFPSCFQDYLTATRRRDSIEDVLLAALRHQRRSRHRVGRQEALARPCNRAHQPTLTQSMLWAASHRRWGARHVCMHQRPIGGIGAALWLEGDLTGMPPSRSGAHRVVAVSRFVCAPWQMVSV